MRFSISAVGSAAKQLHLQRALINTFEKSVAKLLMNLESGTDDFLGNLSMQQTEPDASSDAASNPCFIRVNPWPKISVC
ncbi:MAG: hypothetical protein WKF47_05990 [Geodermatophilaceae bacterium]